MQDSMKFNPNNEYSWEADLEVVFTGKEFEILINSLGFFLNSPLSPRSFGTVDIAASILNNKLVSYVNDGRIQEKPKVDSHTNGSEITETDQL